METRYYIDPNKYALNTFKLTPGEKTEVKLDSQNFEIDANEIIIFIRK